LFHVFEHIEDVFESLDFIISILSDKGRILIQVPYPVTGPFDFVIADHIWHFTKKSITSLLNKANFKIEYIGNEIIKKELTVLAVPGRVDNSLLLNSNDEIRQSNDAVKWLLQYKSFLDSFKNSNESVVIYGTAPAGAWAGCILGDKVAAYIDDDPARINSTFNSKPVLSPKEIDKTIPVIAPFPDFQAQWIADRNKDLNIILFEGSCYNKDLAKTV